MLNSLNPSQREAVEYIDGPSLVIAGAGSGKTRVLTYKIAYLLQHGLKPWNILALTFTNKAANEMKQRIGQLVGDSTARYLQMGTFHSVFSRILRAEADHIPYFSVANNGTANSLAVNTLTTQRNNFTIYDESDSRSLLKAIIKDMKLDDKIYKPAAVHNRISMAKNNIELPADYARSSYHAGADRDARMEKMPQIYAMYQQRLQQSNAMDFDDLLLYTYLLFKNNEEVRQKYGERFQFVLVDEYQDTNAVQQMIVLLMVRDHRHICVVGDDAQSIYGFRGANIDNILDFQQKFGTTDNPTATAPSAPSAPSSASGNSQHPTPNTQYSNTPAPVRLFKLEQNYRSTQNIVNAANSLIEHNQRQIRKQVYSHNDKGDRLQLKFCYSDREEAIIVCKDIMRIKRAEGLKYGDFAILYRTNAQSRTFEEQMRKDGIPYRIYGGLSFYQRKEIKDVIAYFRLVVNQYDEEALRRIINYPTRGIGNTTVDKVIQQARQLGVTPWDVISNPEGTNLPVNKGTMTKLHGFASLINGFAEQASPLTSLTPLDAFELGKQIIQESGISKDIFTGTEPDDISRQENLQEFIDSLREFVDTKREESGEEHIMLSDFLQEVSLMSDIDSDDKKTEGAELNEDGEVDRVVLMTIHSAKGLEFSTVFVVGMEDEIFPSPMCCDSQRAIEEERRLFYVAITRAEKHCILTSVQNRYRYGRPEFDTPSRFLYEINPALIQVHKLSSDDDSPWSKPQRQSFGGGYGSGGGYDSGKYGTGGRYGSGGRSDSRYGGGYQNSKPVATQFKADPKPKETNPFSSPQPEPTRQTIFAPQPEPTRQTFAGRRMTRLPSQRPATPNGVSAAVSPSVNTSDLTIGCKIEHERFGIGTVLNIEGSGENTKATVEFQHTGKKQLLLKFARYKKL